MPAAPPNPWPTFRAWLLAEDGLLPALLRGLIWAALAAYLLWAVDWLRLNAR